MTVPVGSTTFDGPVAWPHQRKFVIVGGRVVDCFFDGTNLKFKWSVGGVQTAYSADIAGGAEPSIAAWQDTGGTWRIMAVWVQSGSGGGRTDTWLYAMPGAFSSDLNTLTWGAAGAVDSNLVRVPDVDVVPDGTGGLAMAVYSQFDPTFGSVTKARRITISSLGAMTLEPTNVVIGGPFPTALEASFPSIAIDPVTKHLGVTYAGVASILFRKATYSAGSWAWGTQRTISAILGSHAAGYASGIVRCYWDPYSGGWIIGGPHLINTSSGLEYCIVWRRDLADVNTDVLFSAPVDPDARQTGGTIAGDPSSGDVLAVGAHHSSFSHPASLRVRTLTRHGFVGTLTDSGFVELDSATDVGYATAASVPGLLHVLFQQGSTGSWNVGYVNHALPQNPTAPTLLSPVGGVFVNVDHAQEFRWTFNSPLGTDTQTASLVEWRVVGAGSWTSTGWVANTAEHWDFPADTFTDAVDYEWRVTTKGATGLESAPAGSGFFTGLGTPDAPSITSPANDATVGARIELVWSAAAQDSYQVRVLGDDGAGGPDVAAVLYDSSEVFEPATRTHTATFDTSGIAVHPEVRVKDSGSFGDWADIHLLTSFGVPGLPRLELFWMDRNGLSTTAALAVGVMGRVVNPPGDPDPLLPTDDDELIGAWDAGGVGGDL